MAILERSTSQMQRFFRSHSAQLHRLAAEGQTPEALFITCSDSRLTPELMFDLSPGQWFMLRNVGNIVPPYWQTELATASVLEYAVSHLQVQNIIICGHTECGGLQALQKGVDLIQNPALARWLDVARPALLPAPSGSSPFPKDDYAIVERNVALQLRHLATYPFVKKRLDTGSLHFHGWVYYLAEQAVGVYTPHDDGFTLIAAS